MYLDKNTVIYKILWLMYHGHTKLYCNTKY